MSMEITGTTRTSDAMAALQNVEKVANDFAKELGSTRGVALDGNVTAQELALVRRAVEEGKIVPKNAEEAADIAWAYQTATTLGNERGGFSEYGQTLANVYGAERDPHGNVTRNDSEIDKVDVLLASSVDPKSRFESLMNTSISDGLAGLTAAVFPEARRSSTNHISVHDQTADRTLSNAQIPGEIPARPTIAPDAQVTPELIAQLGIGPREVDVAAVKASPLPAATGPRPEFLDLAEGASMPIESYPGAEIKRLNSNMFQIGVASDPFGPSASLRVRDNGTISVSHNSKLTPTGSQDYPEFANAIRNYVGSQGDYEAMRSRAATGGIVDEFRPN